MTLTNVTAAQTRSGLVGGGAKWPGDITYSVPGVGAVWASGYNEPKDADYSVLTAQQGADFAAAVELWDALITPKMTLVSDATPGQIRVAFTDVTDRAGPGVAAYAYTPPGVGANASPANGDVWIDETSRGKSFAPGTQSFMLLMHETGHSLGLKHPFESPALPAGYDSKTYTVMSYSTEDYAYTWKSSSGRLSFSSTDTVVFTPMVLDIQAIQQLYGADTATGSGNTTYTITDADTNGRRAIYDAGGTDTLDLSSLSRGSHIDLRPGAYSDLSYYNVEDQIDDLAAQYGAGFEPFIRQNMTNPARPAYEWERNLGIAFSTVIENIKGTGFADTILGNAAANRITGGAGADKMTGFIGNDTYIVDNSGDVVVEGANEGTDTVLSNVSYKLGASARVEVLGTTSTTGTSAINLTGNAYAQTLNGNDGANKLDGLGGMDKLVGRGGNDLYYVDSADDIVVEGTEGGTRDTVYSVVSYALSSSTQIEVLSTKTTSSTTAIDLTGNDFAQMLRGNAGINHLAGRGGADVLTGLAGNDFFVFSALADSGAGAARDTISDFEDYGDNDTIDLSGFAGTLAYRGSGAFTALNQVRAFQSGDDVIVQINTTGSLAADAEILLTNTLIGTVASNDFILT